MKTNNSKNLDWKLRNKCKNLFHFHNSICSYDQCFLKNLKSDDWSDTNSGVSRYFSLYLPIWCIHQHLLSILQDFRIGQSRSTNNPNLYLQIASNISSIISVLHVIAKADQAPAHRVRAPVPKHLRIYFWKFWLHNTNKLYCNQHATTTICILFSILITKA